MKLNELNKIEEGIASSIKGMFTGQGGHQTKVQDIFIKDFVQDALTSLNNAISGGLVGNVSNTQTSSAATNASPASTASSAAIPTTSPTQVPPAQQTGQTMSPQQTATAKMQTRAGVQPTGQKMTAAQRTQAQMQARKMAAAQKPIPVKESAYDKMDRVFESIINIDEQVQLRSISDFMLDWFGKYMQGVDWQANQAIVKQKLDKLQNEYPNNVKQNLTNLASMGLALSKVGTPAGAPAEFAQAQKQQRENPANNPKNVKDELDNLAKTNPAAYNELIKDLKPVPTRGFFYEDN